MRSALVLFALGLAAAAVAAGPLKEGDARSQRIVGGSTTTIRTYPEMAALLFTMSGSSNTQMCGGTVLNNRAILTAAHCNARHPPSWWRVRLGSTNSNRGGTVLNTARIIFHPSYNTQTLDNDIGIMHLTTVISFSNNIRAGQIAGPNYALGDNQAVWAAGWGATRENGASSTTLRHVQIWTINQQICRNQYAAVNQPITDNMLCSGWLNVGGRDQCQGDSGGPLFHNRVVVGVCSFGNGCARPNFSGVNARVSRFSSWINTNR